MPLNFPTSPSVNDTYTYGSQTWKWDGTAWNLVIITPTGPQGPTGPTGPAVTGPTGPTGATGTYSDTFTLNAQTGTTYTAVLADASNKVVTMNNASANTFSIPTNASVAFPVGSQITVVQIGAGQTTINAVTSGTTTISGAAGTTTAPKLRTQFSAATAMKVATDTWYVFGDIV